MRRRHTAEEQKLADDARLLRMWRAFHREEYEAVLTGPHGTVLSELFRMFKNLQHVQPSQLIGLAQSIDWNAIDYTAKLVVVHEFNKAITAVREKHKLDPFDDGLPNQPESPFRTIKTIVLTSPPPGEGAHRGAARSNPTETLNRENVS
jgi:hypothetical protein